MKSERIEVRWDPEFLARVDKAAEELGQSRAKFIERAVTAELIRVEPLDEVVARYPVKKSPTTEKELQGLKNLVETSIQASVDRARHGATLVKDGQRVDPADVSVEPKVPEHPKVTRASKVPPPQFNRAKRLG